MGLRPNEHARNMTNPARYDLQTLEFGVVRGVDLAHPARAYHAAYFVPSELVSRKHFKSRHFPVTRKHLSRGGCDKNLAKITVLKEQALIIKTN